MKHTPLLSAAVILLVGTLFTSCAGHDSRITDRSTQYLGAGGTVVSQQSQVIPDNVSYWDGNAVPGTARIHIRLSEQRAYFYKGDLMVGVSRISTGREGMNTPTGNFKITQKDADHRSNLFGDYVDGNGNVVMANIGVKEDKRPPGTHFLGASMPHFMRIHGGIGMHAGFLPGYAASHGCIRMPADMAYNFYNNAQKGTTVTVTH